MHGTLLCTFARYGTDQREYHFPQRLYQEGQSLFQQKAYAAAIPPLQAFVRQIDAEGKPPACRRRTDGSRVYAGMCCLRTKKTLKV